MITVARAWFSTRIKTRENSAVSRAPAERLSRIGSATSVLAAIVNTATSDAKSRIRATITSSVSEIGADAEAETRSKLTPEAAAEPSANEWRSDAIAVPS